MPKQSQPESPKSTETSHMQQHYLNHLIILLLLGFLGGTPNTANGQEIGSLTTDWLAEAFKQHTDDEPPTVDENEQH